MSTLSQKAKIPSTCSPFVLGLSAHLINSLNHAISSLWELSQGILQPLLNILISEVVGYMV